MKEILLSSSVSGAASAFVECATSAVFKFFEKRKLTKREISKVEIKHFVDNYLKETYPDLLDYEYINRKVYDFILEFAKYVQPNIEIHGSVILNLALTKSSIEENIEGYLQLPESEKWKEIMLDDYSNSPFYEKNDKITLIKNIKMRADKVGLNIEISDKCDESKLQEIIEIVKKYEINTLEK